jgi:PIN domain nuclease of toxin-antitoxin system
VRLLLDTHTLLRWLADQDLDVAADREIRSPANEVYVSSASAWEFSIKKALGKLEVPDDLEQELVAQRFSPLSISVAHALEAGALPRHHDDPFDRMLVAQAKLEGLAVATRDRRFELYGVEVVPA